ncbi:plasma membrane SNARE protein (Sec9) [Apiospora arundinis]
MPMFRQIKPARPVNGDGVDARGHDSNKKNAVEACHDCRRLKIKCDGARPKCGHCTSKRRTCGYIADERESRKSRLDALEKFVDNLRDLPSEQAGKLLQGWRKTRGRLDSGPKLVEAAKEAADTPSSSSNTTPSISPESNSSHQIITHPTSVTSPNGHHPPEILSQFSPPHNTVTLDSPWRQVLLWLPPPDLTRRFVETFFSCSGKLFHVFSKDQINQCFETTFQTPNNGSLEYKADVCCLMTVAAIGAQYEHEVIDVEAQHTFYDVARHHLEAVIQARPLDAIKITTLFCLYNIMDKTTVAVAYVEIGLGTCKRYRLECKMPPQGEFPEARWAEYRKAWRSLIFFSSWLSASLGYVPGNDSVPLDTQLPDLEINTSTDLAEIVQNEMAKIALLKAKVMRMHLAFKELTSRSIRSIMDDLQTWYSRLPWQMRLENLMHSEHSASIRRSGFHVHLLYLGGMMLCYRRIAAQITQPMQQARRIPFPEDEVTLLLAHCEEAVVAAATSARILNLLLGDNGVFKRCWLIIFQSYTSCVILLHAVAQKQVHNFVVDQWQEELMKAAHCLRVLEFCGSLDPVAAQFHRELSAIHRLLDQTSPGVNPAGTTAELVNLPAADQPLSPASHGRYLLTIPPNADPSRAQISAALLSMLCNPFGNHSFRKLAEETVLTRRWTGGSTDPTRHEATQMIERLDWDYESAQPFRLNVGSLALGSGNCVAPMMMMEMGGVEAAEAAASGLGASAAMVPPLPQSSMPHMTGSGTQGWVHDALAAQQPAGAAAAMPAEMMFGRMRIPQPCGWVTDEQLRRPSRNPQ